MDLMLETNCKKYAIRSTARPWKSPLTWMHQTWPGGPKNFTEELKTLSIWLTPLEGGSENFWESSKRCLKTLQSIRFHSLRSIKCSSSKKERSMQVWTSSRRETSYSLAMAGFLSLRYWMSWELWTRLKKATEMYTYPTSCSSPTMM